MSRIHPTSIVVVCLAASLFGGASAYAIEGQGSPVQGQWTLHGTGGEVRSQRFTFLGDGTFRHRGDVTSCAGRYHVTRSGIEITYDVIDGQRVQRGLAPMRKHLPFVGGRRAFMVDRYRYERAGR